MEEIQEVYHLVRDWQADHHNCHPMKVLCLLYEAKKGARWQIRGSSGLAAVRICKTHFMSFVPWNILAVYATRDKVIQYLYHIQ
jgi:hypothetical protein